ncbi:MAG: LysM peptidoglycan-binding domain-containing protein [Deltaproteobacteria bacterium]|nr:LysM peptidoglycan-binding domain-containing protein [Deltaproteobacteria bacterium]
MTQRRRPPARSLLVACGLLLAVLLDTRPSAAQRVVHRVRFGENLASIAKTYYGDPSYASLLALINGGDPGSSLSAGERIRVPTAWSYTVSKPSTVVALAKRLVGDRRRAPALSAFNNLGKRKKLKAGQTLWVPFTVTHVVAADETFAAIAQRYHGKATHARLIAAWNFIEATQPASGAQLEVPIGHVRILPVRLQELVSSQLLGVQLDGPSEDREALQEANALLRRGRYWEVPMRLVRLLAREQSSDAHVAEIYKLLAIAYVALDQHALAVSCFEEALLRQPTLTLDAVIVSPKVIRAYMDARSKRRGNTP